MLLGLAVLTGCPDDPTPPAATSSATPAASPSASASASGSVSFDQGKIAQAAVQNAVIASMKAGFERHDLKAYMLVWAADGQLARARTEKRDPYEVKMRRDEIERTKQVWFVGPAGNTKLSFDDVEVTFEQGHAKLRWTLTATVTGEDGKSVVDKSGEMYLLRKVGTAWRITRNRVWPIETKRGDEVVRYDAATWDKLDAAVEAAKQSNDQRRLAASLADAYRFAEAHAAAKALTEKPGATKADWTWRMQMAALAGEGQDALAAMARSQGDPGDGTVGARGDARRSP